MERVSGLMVLMGIVLVFGICSDVRILRVGKLGIPTGVIWLIECIAALEATFTMLYHSVASSSS